MRKHLGSNLYQETVIPHTEQKNCVSICPLFKDTHGYAVSQYFIFSVPLSNDAVWVRSSTICEGFDISPK